MTSLSRRDTALLADQWHDLGMDRSRKRSLHARPQTMTYSAWTGNEFTPDYGC